MLRGWASLPPYPACLCPTTFVAVWRLMTLQEELTLLRQIVANLGELRDTRAATIKTAHLVRAMAKPEHIAIAQQTLQQR